VQIYAIQMDLFLHILVRNHSLPWTGNSYPAQMTGTDPYSDLAILQDSTALNKEQMKPLLIRNSSALQIGESMWIIKQVYLSINGTTISFTRYRFREERMNDIETETKHYFFLDSLLPNSLAKYSLFSVVILSSCRRGIARFVWDRIVYFTILDKRSSELDRLF
jgi:hypothetical protein